MIINVFPKGLKKILQAGINMEGADIKALLLTSSYTFDVTDEFISDLTGEATGYTRQACSLTAAADTDNPYAYLTAAGVLTFPTVTGAIRYVVIAKDTGIAGTSPLILCIDLEAATTLTGQNCKTTFTGNVLEIG